MDFSLNSAAQQRFWRTRLSRWRRSGLSKSQYCREQGLSVHQFHYWRKRLGERADQTAEAVSQTLLPVQLMVDVASSSAVLTVRLPNALGIEVSGGFELALLQAVVQILSE